MKSYWYAAMYYQNEDNKGHIGSVIKSNNRRFPFKELDRLQRRRGDYPYVLTFYKRVSKLEYLEFWNMVTDDSGSIDDEITANYRRFCK